MRALVCIVFITFSSYNSYGSFASKQLRSSLNINVLYVAYHDIKISEHVTGVDLPQAISVELAYRAYKIFNFSVFTLFSPDDTIQGYGLGVRIDLPGFFFMGARYWDLFRKGKNYPVNTSFYMNTLYNEVTNINDQKIAAVSSKTGLTAEVFILGESLSLLIDGGLYTLQGNSHFSSAVGLGYSF